MKAEASLQQQHPAPSVTKIKGTYLGFKSLVVDAISVGTGYVFKPVIVGFSWKAKKKSINEWSKPSAKQL